MRHSRNLAVFFLIVMISGCATIQRISNFVLPKEHPGAKVFFPDYSGPKALITVTDFDVKANKAVADTGKVLREMLSSALLATKRFTIAKNQTVASIQSERGIDKADVKTAELIISATLIEFEPQVSGGREGVGGGGGMNNGLLGGLLGSSQNKARFGIDLKIIDVASSKVLSSTYLQGQASDASGPIMGDIFGFSEAENALTGYVNTPMDKAIRICILEAARYISESVPENYYKY